MKGKKELIECNLSSCTVVTRCETRWNNMGSTVVNTTPPPQKKAKYGKPGYDKKELNYSHRHKAS